MLTLYRVLREIKKEGNKLLKNVIMCHTVSDNVISFKPYLIGKYCVSYFEKVQKNVACLFDSCWNQKLNP